MRTGTEPGTGKDRGAAQGDGGPDTVARYRVLGPLTSAGGEQRFLARDPRTGALAELTRVEGDDGTLALTESAEALRRAAGPGVPLVLDTVRGADEGWLVSPYVPALTCAEAGALMYGGLPARTVRALGAVLDAALARLHATGTAHGALADDGVLLRGDGPCLTRPRPERGGTCEGDRADLARVLGQLASGPLDGAPADAPAEASTPVALPARLVGALAQQTERALALEQDDPPPEREPEPVSEPDTFPLDTAAPGPRTPARRTLLAGAVGVLAGAGGVAAWVGGRGGTAALTGSRDRDGDRGRDGAAGHRVPRGTAPPALWRYDGPAPGTPHRQDQVLTDVDADRVYLVEPPYVTALRLSDGSRVWRRDDTGIQTGGLRPLSEGTLVAVRRGRLLGLSAGTGRQLWERRVELPTGWGELELVGVERGSDVVHLMADDLSQGRSTPTPSGLKVRVFAYDTRRAAVRWEHTFSAPRRTNVGFGPLGEDGLLLSVGQGDEGIELSGLSSSDGTRTWRHTHRWTADRLRSSDANAWSDAASRRLLCSAEGRLYGTSFTSTAGPRWTTDLRDDKEHPGPAALHIAGTRALRGRRRTLVVTDPYQTVYAVDPRDGRELWRHLLERDRTFPARKDTRAPDTAASTAWRGRPLLVGGREGVTALDPRTGVPLWRFRAAEETTVCSTFAAGRLALLAASGSVYALRLG
ncbi:PQQ-binding-like beta-propeller repeat protein [Streptomyces sp. NPDC048172]|uniref:outer membrane protein assembly factor BamB family protein n=1 Tax=Streptomyces sp. NPDC048172 TaxID=3365505 RepID=UPI00371377AE